jgi:uncharacterized protein YjbI with pentapeptide repeats
MMDSNSTNPESQIGLQSLADLRREHLALQRELANSKEFTRTDAIRAFLSRAHKTGTFLGDPKERQVAQAILDFWNSEVPSGKEKGSTAGNNESALLDSFEPTARPSEVGPRSSPNDEDSRTLIRFAARARQWEAEQHGEDYLLVGESIQRASKFRNMDSGIDALVRASEEKVERARFRRALWICSITVFVLTACAIIGSYAFYSGRRQIYTDRATVELRANATNQRKATFFHPLYWTVGRFLCKDYTANPQNSESSGPSETIQRAFGYLECVQSRLGTTQIQLSETTIDHVPFVNLEGISLDALQMMRSDIIRFNFDGASLSGVTFTGSRFLDSSFVQADLELARFDNAKFLSSDFSRANLSEALFDGAKFCHTSVVDADLNGASFWNTKFDDAFPHGFEGTAWWLAAGWNSQQLDKLNQLPRPDFKKSGSKYSEKLRLEEARANVDPLSLADSLNRYAWWLAINGATNENDQPSIDGILDGLKNNDLKSFCSKADSDHAKFPDNAQAAAEKAVCLTRQLSKAAELSKQAAEPSSNKQSIAYRNYEAIANDTLGYILLQRGMADEANYYLAKALGRQPVAAEAPASANHWEPGTSTPKSASKNYEMEFRLAVAEFLFGQKQLKDGQKQGALHMEDGLFDMEEAIDGGYVPTHERALLPQIKGTDFETRLNAELAKFHPNLQESPGYACSW